MGQGRSLFGDKTALSAPSAFDRINVRRLFILLEKAISTVPLNSNSLNSTMSSQERSLESLVEPFLRDIQGRSWYY